MNSTRPVSLRLDPAGVLQTERRSWQRTLAAHVLERSEPHKILKAAWPDDTRAQAITRGAVTQTTTADLWTFDPTIAYRSLAPSSAALALFQMGLALNLEGVSTIRIPSVAGLPVRPVFVSEGQPAPAVQWNFAADTVLGPARKILLLSAVSKELENSTPETASAVIGRVLADCANGSIDATAFGTTAAADATPAGLLHGVTPIAAAAAGPDAMYEDLGNLTSAIGAAGIDPTGAVFVTGPREATIIKAKVGAKFDFPVLVTLARFAASQFLRSAFWLRNVFTCTGPHADAAACDATTDHRP
jgi:hypothetical protein